ncbi:hypothetical protein Anapl_06710 [Anas platyrhynchos]|uniref:Uncharacterized protein n=1 Tax=Anas platyrhynchos TaxID=8839 RepID=R0KAA8_ANAPL|nr:hypothetical protein Anapl_06710 [Anas platyrhynchos]
MTVQQQSSLSGTASNLRKNPSMTHNTNRFEHEVWTATAFCRSRGVVTTEQRGREESAASISDPKEGSLAPKGTTHPQQPRSVTQPYRESSRDPDQAPPPKTPTHEKDASADRLYLIALFLPPEPGPPVGQPESEGNTAAACGEPGESICLSPLCEQGAAPTLGRHPQDITLSFCGPPPYSSDPSRPLWPWSRRLWAPSRSGEARRGRPEGALRKNGDRRQKRQRRDEAISDTNSFSKVHPSQREVFAPPELT